MHCVKSVQIWSFFWSVFSCLRTEYRDLREYSVRIQENTDQEKFHIWTFSRSDANKSYFAVGTDHTRRVKFRMRLLPSMGLWEIHVVSLDAMSAVYNVNLLVCELPPHVLYRTFCTNMAFLYYGFVLFLV